MLTPSSRPTESPSQIKDATRRGRANLLNGLCMHKNAFTIGWCAAFIQWGRVHVVQRAEMRS
jgi:hypothetical protein